MSKSGSEMRQSQSSEGITPAFIWKKRGKPRKSSPRTTEIRTGSRALPLIGFSAVDITSYNNMPQHLYELHNRPCLSFVAFVNHSLAYGISFGIPASATEWLLTLNVISFFLQCQPSKILSTSALKIILCLLEQNKVHRYIFLHFFTFEGRIETGELPSVYANSLTTLFQLHWL